MAPALAPAALFGLLIGSFLNVVAWRLPRGESLVRPRSRCPGCATQLKPYDNVPVVSWLVLRGRCRGCGERISARYPVVEAITAALYVAVVAAKWGDVLQTTLGLVLVTFLVPIAVIDFDLKVIPNKLTGPAAVLAVALGAVLEPSYLPEQLIAGAGALVFFMLPALIHKKGMGMGDVKLAAVLGLYLGRNVAPAIMIGLVLGVIVGAAVVAVKGVSEGRRTKVPFGPFLAMGALVAFFAGDAIVHSYLGRF
ncbi:MAG: leader peptidase (prepilin peptidase) / N-methyltransferase [Baekduia sp.]|jgi:leader peptidase (prepilin peptidase)/N-methyltransferase|nr:leader peptidase (prepilin peptidase) / N-methyltransferase [Baekduia sp.]